MQSTPEEIKDDLVVTMDYTLFIEDKEVDSSKESGPIQFIQGQGNIIPGLEKALYRMAIGDRKKVSVPASEGYGDYDDESVMEIPRSEFPTDIPLKSGVEIELENPEGEAFTAIIMEVNDSTVTLDFNHPLAGMDLVFDVEILGLRHATSEELAHGHAHYENEQD
jgi:FKBP-type peptidyl-prolyl cis-trans isomerase SlyD